MNNKTVLITGAAKRIGAALAKGLHANGYDIIIHYNRSESEATVLCDDLNKKRGNSAFLIQADLLDTSKYKYIVDQAYQFKQRLDVLVNNASVFNPTHIDQISESDWDNMMQINLKAPSFISLAAAEYLRAASGSIINLTDIHAERPLKNHLVYSVSKAGLVMLTKSLARELGADIRVNGISPGAILWPDTIEEQVKKEILSKTVMGKTGQCDDITNAVLFILENCKYMTGEVLIIDGGRTLYS